MDDHPSRRSCRPVLVAIAASGGARGGAGGRCARAADHNRTGERRGARTEPALRAAAVRRAGRDRIRRDPGLRRSRAACRLRQGRAAERERGPDRARPTPRSRHVHRDLACGVRRWASRLRCVRLPCRRPGCEPGGRRGAGPRRRNAASVSVLSRSSGRSTSFCSSSAAARCCSSSVSGGLEPDAVEAVPAARRRFALTVATRAGIVLQGAAGGFGLGEALSRDVVSASSGRVRRRLAPLRPALAVASALLLAWEQARAGTRAGSGGAAAR